MGDEPMLLGRCILAGDVVHPYGFSGEVELEEGDGMLQVQQQDDNAIAQGVVGDTAS